MKDNILLLAFICVVLLGSSQPTEQPSPRGPAPAPQAQEYESGVLYWNHPVAFGKPDFVNTNKKAVLVSSTGENKELPFESKPEALSWLQENGWVIVGGSFIEPSSREAIYVRRAVE